MANPIYSPDQAEWDKLPLSERLGYVLKDIAFDSAGVVRKKRMISAIEEARDSVFRLQGLGLETCK